MTTPVLRVITRLNIGGPARQALLLSRALEPEYRTRLVAGQPAVGEGELTDPDVPVTRISLARPARPVQDVRAHRALARLLSADRSAIVHSHMAKAGALARLAAHRSDVRPRTVHTFHGHVLDGYFAAPVERAFIAAERWLARRTDVLVAVSHEVRDSLLALEVGRPDQYRVIANGYDLGAHRTVDGRTGALRERLRLADDTPLVGLVGRLVPIKDPALAIRAVTSLPDVHLAVVGDGELRAELEAETVRRSIADRVHFVGWIRDIPSVMADLDVVLLTSANEGTPSSLIEAGACARPVVATDVGGVRSVVEDGRSGIVVPPGDQHALTSALGHILGDPAAAAAMGRAGRELSRRFDSDRFVAEIRALYRELTDDA